MTKEKIQELVRQMTLEEKCSLLSGKDMWHTVPIKRLGIPSMMVSDGPHGLRTQKGDADHIGLNESIKAVCFPAASATTASFDPEMLEKMGEALGKEAQAVDLGVVLGPAVCMKRSPLCGRNFEYMSEDPYLAGEMAAAMISGIQSQGVGTSIKHFAANNIEWRRMTNSSNVNERALREIYFPAFETAVKKAQPWTLMCSYNRINGTFSSDNKWLLTDVLRDQWGFEGFVVTDWGAMNDRVQGVLAGCDLEMPGKVPSNDEAVAQAVREGKIREADVDRCVERILNIVFKYAENHRSETFDYDADTELAAKIEEQCMVLLKNDDHILPLKKGQKILFVGGYAEKPRFQGGGSSHINCSRIISVLDSIHADPQRYGTVSYVEGFGVDAAEPKQEAQQKAVEAARQADVVVVFAGLPDSFESEGFDRTDLEMPKAQNEMIAQLAKVNPNLVVVLHNGSPIAMPWLDKVKGVLECYLGGQAVGKAQAEILYGYENPSGRLPETFPLRVEDTPCYLNFPGNGIDVNYDEGIFIGYRYYASRKMPVLFPFGYGLSYTSFAFSALKVEPEKEGASVSVKVTNTGKTAGRQVVQLYVSDKTGAAVRPIRELKGFTKVYLEPGQTTEVTMQLDRRSFAYWDETKNDWKVPNGPFEIQICDNAMEPVLTAPFTVTFGEGLIQQVDENTPMGIIMKNPQAAQMLMQILQSAGSAFSGGQKADGSQEDPEKQKQKQEAIMSNKAVQTMMDGMPLRALKSFSGGRLDNDGVARIIQALNQFTY